MLRPKSTCLLCSFRAARISIRFPIQQTASMRTESRSAARKDLAPPSTIKSGSRNGARKRNPHDGPFGALNQKVAGIRGVPERTAGSVIRKTNEDPGVAERGEMKREARAKREHAKKERGFHALKMSGVLHQMSYTERDQIKKEVLQHESFSNFPLLPAVQDSIYTQALGGMVDVKPTPIQSLAIPALLGKTRKKAAARPEQEQFLLAAETGSGKTLAYLIPTINAMKIAEAEDLDVKEWKEETKKQEMEEKLRKTFAFKPPVAQTPHPNTGRPRVIILIPSNELAQQVGKTVKSFAHTVKFKSAAITTDKTAQVIRNSMFSPKGIDVVVATPHLLLSLVESDPNILSRVSHLIIDEADSLMDGGKHIDGFGNLVSAIIDRSIAVKQLILCSATIPRRLDKQLRERFPDLQRIVTPKLHSIPRRIQLSVVDIDRVPYQGNRDLACADTIWSIGKAAAEHVDASDPAVMDVKRVLVFVNQRESTIAVRDYLMSKGIDAIALSRDAKEERRGETLASFTTAAVETVPKSQEHPGGLADNQANYVPFGQEQPPVKRSLPNVKVVVTTDLGSRGIDTLAVRNVVLYDVPQSSIDFIHRLGRTGRMGRRGRGYVLVGKNDRKDIVAEVREGMHMGQALI